MWHHFFFSKEIKTNNANKTKEVIEVVQTHIDKSNVADVMESGISVKKEMGTTSEAESGNSTWSGYGTPEKAENVLDQNRQKVTLQAGETLRMMAQDHFGNRDFWVYIYFENKDKISNPNKVPTGTVLVLPTKSTYSINAADTQSVAKAKALGDTILKKF